jgi:hypothetical protein
MKNNRLGRVLRTIIIILVGLAAATNVLGGIGKVCASFMTRDFPPLWSLLDYQWFYQLIMFATTLAGLAGVWTTIRLVRGGQHVVRNAIIVLVTAIVVTAANVIVSLSLRGKAAPSDMRMYFNIFTLAVVFISQMPALRDRIDFSRTAPPADRLTSAGMEAIVAGLGVLGVGLWAGPSHMYQGESWISVLVVPIILIGGGLITGGLGALGAVVISIYRQENARSAA